MQVVQVLSLVGLYRIADFIIRPNIK